MLLQASAPQTDFILTVGVGLGMEVQNTSFIKTKKTKKNSSGPEHFVKHLYLFSSCN